MNKQILILASFVALSINANAAPCTPSNLKGTWEYVITKDTSPGDCGAGKSVSTWTVVFDGSVTGAGTRVVKFYHAKPGPSCIDGDGWDQVFTYKINSGKVIFESEGYVGSAKTCDVTDSTMTVFGAAPNEPNQVYEKIGGSNGPTNPTKPTKPLFPEDCLNCGAIVHEHPLPYPPSGFSEACNEKNVVGTWKETKDFTDAPGQYCQWKHKSTEIITIEKGVHQGPIVVFKTSGYIKGEHTVVHADDGWNCQNFIEDRQYTRLEMGKLDNGFVTQSLHISDIRPMNGEVNSPKVPGKTTHTTCRIMGGKFMIFDDPAKTRLEKQ